MSRTHELREGMRVKVVAPDPHSDTTTFVGRCGVIVGVPQNASYDWDVQLDGDAKGDTTYFTSQEIVPLAETTILEGVVQAYDGDEGLAYAYVDDTDVIVELAKLDGKSVYVTIEVLEENPGEPVESDGEPRE